MVKGDGHLADVGSGINDNGIVLKLNVFGGQHVLLVAPKKIEREVDALGQVNAIVNALPLNHTHFRPAKGAGERVERLGYRQLNFGQRQIVESQNEGNAPLSL